MRLHGAADEDDGVGGREDLLEVRRGVEQLRHPRIYIYNALSTCAGRWRTQPRFGAERSGQPGR